jgi:hypothetical protein
MKSYFPIESVEKAKDIAKKLASESKSPIDWAIALNSGKAFPFSYGMKDVIQKGVFANFLSEHENQTDCFCLPGMLYPIAQQLNLEPQIYSISGMVNCIHNRSYQESTIADHLDLFIKINGEQWSLDPFSRTVGKVTEQTDSYYIVEDIQTGNNSIVFFESMTHVPEEQYVNEIYNRKDPKNFKELLSMYHLTIYDDERIRFHFSPETNEFITSLEIPTEIIDTNLIPEYDLGKLFRINLRSPVTEDGSLDYDNAMIEIYRCNRLSFMKQYSEMPFDIFTIPYSVIKEINERLVSTGFSFFGLIDSYYTKKPRKLAKVAERIIDTTTYNPNAPDAKTLEILLENTDYLIDSRKDHLPFTHTKEDISEKFHVFSLEKNNLDRDSFETRYQTELRHLNRFEENNDQDMIHRQRFNIMLYIDKAMYHQENSLGTSKLNVNDPIFIEHRKLFYILALADRMSYLTGPLELQEYQEGLKKILVHCE